MPHADLLNPAASGPSTALGPGTDFPANLRYWRMRRGYSQMRLAAEGGLSQRHLSYLESGRSQPSRDMVLRLGRVLDMPLRHRNSLLLAAGYAPAYRERSLSDPELAAVSRALDFTLKRHEPYPALVVDRLWHLVRANEAAFMLMSWLLGVSPAKVRETSENANVLALFLDPKGLRPYLINAEAVVPDLLDWIRREVVQDGPVGEAANLLATLTELVGPDFARGEPAEMQRLPFLPISIRKEGTTLNLFTTISTLGTPHDVVVHELRVETFFPADEATEAWLIRQSLARKS